MDSFFGIGIVELLVVAVIALIVLGPERLPSAARAVAKFFGQLRQLSSEFSQQFGEELKVLDEMNPRNIVKDIVDPALNPLLKDVMSLTKLPVPGTTTAKNAVAGAGNTPKPAGTPLKPPAAPPAKSTTPASPAPVPPAPVSPARVDEPAYSILPPAAQTEPAGNSAGAATAGAEDATL